MKQPEKRPLPLKVDPVLIILVAAVSFLLLFRLDHRPFWQDEAETACLARNVLKYGVPLAFDGVNLISQEEGREFGPDHLWRWSPWLQIYLTAAAFRLGGLTTTAGRLPFAVSGLACVCLVYLLVKRRFGDIAWARWAAALLGFSVVFLLFSRQCRYYSVGALLVLVSLYAFRGKWQSDFAPAALLVVSLGLLFHTNHLLFFSYTGAFLLAAVLLYRQELPLRRIWKLALVLGLMVLPGLALFRLQQQADLLDFTLFWANLERHLGDLFQFMLPLPLGLGLLWCWYRLLRRRGELASDPGAWFTFFLGCVILGNIFLLALAPQGEHRYLLHLYPLSAIILGWVVCRVWRYHPFSGALLALLLMFTNWLHFVPLDWLRISYRPLLNDVFMITYPNVPLKLYLTELSKPYPDVNQNLIRFFQAHARPGETILTTYGDLPLQFYTSCQVLGSLQGRVPALGDRPHWVVQRWHTHRTRDLVLSKSEEFIRQHLRLSQDYRVLVLPCEDEIYGNRADPYYHRFVPALLPLARLTIHQRRSEQTSHVP